MKYVPYYVINDYNQLACPDPHSNRKGDAFYG